MATQVVFIQCVGHSGSTVLDLALGGHPRLVGLGEVHALIDAGSKWVGRTATERCSCGSTIDTCSFWGPVCARFRELPEATPGRRYRVILDAFAQTFGPERIPVDSSKTLAALEVLRQVEGVEIKVVRLIRDVRAWTVSMRDVRRREGDFRLRDLIRKNGIRGLLRYPRRMAISCFLYWYRRNRRETQFLEREGITTCQIGYEELALYPEPTLARVCEFLGIEPTGAMLDLEASGSHSILGNRMRLQKEKRRRIVYDCRWFWRRDWQLPAALLPHIMRYNERETYRHVRDGVWKR